MSEGPHFLLKFAEPIFSPLICTTSLDKNICFFKEHRTSFITASDFDFLSRHGINTVRIPVGWWITQDPYPPSPFVGGSLAALDLAFSWAQYVMFPDC